MTRFALIVGESHSGYLRLGAEGMGWQLRSEEMRGGDHTDTMRYRAVTQDKVRVARVRRLR